jgi:diguanylate cyclase (GGDEF)-like protein
VCLILLFWTGAFAVSLWYSLGELEKHAVDSARIQARTAFEKDVMYRRWNAMQGGVMAPVVPGGLEPNSYLPPLGRDITSTDGILYTKINPAFMTRLVHELGASESGVLGHITSNTPIRKGNEPDAWESAALTRMEAGTAHEASSLEVLNNALYLRFIRPLMVEASCLPCHSSQGYKLGQVRGGISISVPMAPFATPLLEARQRQSLAHVGLWSLGMVGVGGAALRLSRGVKERERVEVLLRKEVAQRLAAETMLRVAAGTDALTHLPNRRAALERLDMEIARYKRNKVVFSLMLVDMDHFKNINDTWGHEVGDKALVEVAGRLKSMLREQDTVARWGGEEFLVIITASPRAGALVAAEKIRAVVADAPLVADGERVTLTVSIGVTEFQPNQDIGFSIKHADDALYAAKRLGRNRVERARAAG